MRIEKIKAVVYGLIALTIVFFITAFYNMTFDVQKWTDDCRLTSSIIGLLLYIIAYEAVRVQYYNGEEE